MIDVVNYCGFHSGAHVNKGADIPHTLGEKQPVPVIDASPMTFECTVLENILLDRMNIFVAGIDNLWIEESELGSFKGSLEGNRLDATALNLIVSCLDAYYKLGEKADVCRKP